MPQVMRDANIITSYKNKGDRGIVIITQAFLSCALLANFLHALSFGGFRNLPTGFTPNYNVAFAPTGQQLI